MGDIAEAVSMSSKVFVLSKRPAHLKDEVTINFSCSDRTPLKCREEPEFPVYFKKIWKEMDMNDEGK